MEDQTIIDLFFTRDEQAIAETRQKFGSLCMQLAYNILKDPREAEECVNDAYLHLWNTIPPTRPTYLKAFVCKILRNCSLKRLEYLTAQKRSCPGELSFEEVEPIIPQQDNLSDGELGELINAFLLNEKPLYRQVFLRKYWFFDSIEDIAVRFGYSQGAVKSMLLRIRRRLRKYLEKEGIQV
ncbi:MAG: RNA polymerase sigma factor [Oscillospiraceae bacterium]|nr:RNA polymerase sigma factor [Oscillospiraceae bacterium]